MWLERMEKALASVVLDSSLMNRLQNAHVSSDCVMCAFVQVLCVCNRCTFMRPWIQCGWKSYFCIIRVNLEFEGRTLKCS